MTAWLVELILTGALVACVIGLELVSRRIKHPADSLSSTIGFAFCLAVLIWIPSEARTAIVGGFAILIGIELGIGFAAFAIAIVVPTGLWLPGGVSVLLLGILTIVGLTQIRDARRHLVRLSRAATLVANEPTPHEVELTGKIRAVSPTFDPVYGKPCAMWKVHAKTSRESESLVELRGATGSAIIDPATIRLEWSVKLEIVTGDAARAAAEKLKLDLEGDKLLLHVLPEGTECYVVGVPSWELAPPNSAGLYRDAPILPTFRSTPEHPAWFADRSEAQLRAEYRWALASWAVQGALCAAIAVAQVGGWA